MLFLYPLNLRSEANRTCVVAPSRRSEAGERKVRRKRTYDGYPVRSFEALMADVATLTKNQVRIEGTAATFNKYARPTPLQEKVLDLLEVSYRM